MSLEYEPASETLHIPVNPRHGAALSSAIRGLHPQRVYAPPPDTALEATQGQMDDFFSQLPYKCYLEEVASVGY